MSIDWITRQRNQQQVFSFTTGTPSIRTLCRMFLSLSAFLPLTRPSAPITLAGVSVESTEIVKIPFSRIAAQLWVSFVSVTSTFSGEPLETCTTEVATQAFGRPSCFVPITYMPYDKLLNTAGFIEYHPFLSESGKCLPVQCQWIATVS